MKTFKALLLCTLLPFVGKVEGHIFRLIGHGDLEEANTQYFTSNSHLLKVVVYQVTPGGDEVWGAERARALVYRDPKRNGQEVRLCKSKGEVDTIHREMLVQAFSAALTNKNIDPNLPVIAWSYTSRVHPTISLNPWYFFGHTAFIYPRSSNGQYSLPDFSNYEISHADQMIFDLPNGVEWVRIEKRVPVYGKIGAQSANILVFDSRTDTSGQIDLPRKVLVLDTKDVLDGNHVKISMTGSNYPFTVIVDGKPGAEIPLEITIFSGVLHIKGEPGRIVTVESSDRIGSNWTDSGLQLELPAYPFPIPYGFNGDMRIFRARTLPLVPGL